MRCLGISYSHRSCISGEDAVIDTGQVKRFDDIVLEIAQDELVELRDKEGKEEHENT